MVSGNLAYSIGWALVHFVWQGAIVGAATMLVLAALRKSGPNFRYIVACAGMLIMVILPIATAVTESRRAVRVPATMTQGVSQESITATVSVDNALSANPQHSFSREDLEAWLPAAVLFWFVGVCVLSLRTAVAWWIVQRMRRRAFTPAVEICSSIRSLALRMRVTRPVQIMESALVTVPTVIGSLRPIILWPVRAMTGLSAEQIEALVAHELAHIRRLDYFVNMLQSAVEILLFYHPAVWMVSRRIRVERENCCDDLAVAVCGDRLLYANALAGLEQLRSDRAALALRASGGSLIQRVRRLLGVPVSDRRNSAWIAIGMIALVVALAASARQGTFFAKPPMIRSTVPPASEAAQQVPQPPREPPVPPVPRVPPASPGSELINSKGENRSSWSSFGQRFEIRYAGAISLSDDGQDITGISPNSYLIVSETSLLGGFQRIELRGRADGTIERKYSTASGERSYEPEGRAWFAGVLPLIVRRAGFAAEQRVARILKQEGPLAVLAEISRLQTDHVRRVYFTRFFEQAKPAGLVLIQTLEQARRQISSDFELTELLIAAGNTLTFSTAEWDAYFQAFESVSSDFEHRRGLSVAADSNLPPEILARLLRSSDRIGSSFELASLLLHVNDRYKLEGEVRDAYLDAARQISSTYEKNRVLEALGKERR
jgi:beta-lactamase regulating signal transducer with metallopeptidase domain